jgi:hypothetical protein
MLVPAHQYQQVMALIRCILSLPADVVGCRVFFFLKMKDLGRLDSAVVRKKHRHELQQAFAFASVDIDRSYMYSRHGWKHWKWCVEKGVILKWVEFYNDDVADANLLTALLNLTTHTSIVRYVCRFSADVAHSVCNVLSNESIRNKITGLELSGSCDGASLASCEWSELEKLTTLQAGFSISERLLLNVLNGKASLTEITFSGLALHNVKMVGALCRHAPSTKSLTFRNCDCPSELLVAVGQHFHNLGELAIRFDRDGAAGRIEEAALMALGTGCCKLRQLNFEFVRFASESVILSFARNCPELERLVLHSCASITDAVLLALATGCPKLRILDCDTWAVQTLAAVDAAQSLLSRLECWPFTGHLGTPPAVLARILSHLRSAQKLWLRGISPAHSIPLQDIRLEGAKWETLFVERAGGEAVALDRFVFAVAVGCAALRAVHIQEGLCISASTLFALAECCPRITRLVVKSLLDEPTESTLLTLIRSWPQIYGLLFGTNVSFTDSVLRAMAEHCTLLEELDLRDNTSVSEAAVLAAAKALPQCNFKLPHSFSAEARLRVSEAVATARAEVKASKRAWQY